MPAQRSGSSARSLGGASGVSRVKSEPMAPVLRPQETGRISRSQAYRQRQPGPRLAISSGMGRVRTTPDQDAYLMDQIMFDMYENFNKEPSIGSAEYIHFYLDFRSESIRTPTSIIDMTLSQAEFWRHAYRAAHYQDMYNATLLDFWHEVRHGLDMELRWRMKEGAYKEFQDARSSLHAAAELQDPELRDAVRQLYDHVDAPKEER